MMAVDGNYEITTQDANNGAEEERQTVTWVS